MHIHSQPASMLNCMMGLVGRILESWVASKGHAARTLHGIKFPFAVKKEEEEDSPTVVVKKESPSPDFVVVKKVTSWSTKHAVFHALNIEV